MTPRERIREGAYVPDAADWEYRDGQLRSDTNGLIGDIDQTDAAYILNLYEVAKAAVLVLHECNCEDALLPERDCPHNKLNNWLRLARLLEAAGLTTI